MKIEAITKFCFVMGFFTSFRMTGGKGRMTRERKNDGG